MREGEGGQGGGEVWYLVKALGMNQLSVSVLKFINNIQF
jgi:hypothetical protein